MISFVLFPQASQSSMNFNISEWNLGNITLSTNHSGKMFYVPVCERPVPVLFRFSSTYSQLSPCGHLALTDNPIIRTAAKSPAETNYRRLTKINSRYYGLSLLRTCIRGPYSVCNKGVGIYTVFIVNNVIHENKKQLMKITPAANKANCRSADYFKGSKLKIRTCNRAGYS